MRDALAAALAGTNSKRKLYLQCDSGLGNKLRVLPTGILLALSSNSHLVLTPEFAAYSNYFQLPRGVVGGRNGKPPKRLRWSAMNAVAASGPLTCLVKLKGRCDPNGAVRFVQRGGSFGLKINQEVDELVVARAPAIWNATVSALRLPPTLSPPVTPLELNAAVVSLFTLLPTRQAAQSVQKLTSPIGWGEPGTLRVGIHVRFRVDSSSQRRFKGVRVVPPQLWQCVEATVASALAAGAAAGAPYQRVGVFYASDALDDTLKAAKATLSRPGPVPWVLAWNKASLHFVNSHAARPGKLSKGSSATVHDWLAVSEADVVVSGTPSSFSETAVKRRGVPIVLGMQCKEGNRTRGVVR